METTAPFELSYDPGFAELLYNLGASLALSTYQAGKVVLLSPVDSHTLIQLPRTFASAMGMAVKDDLLAIATKHNVEVLKCSTSLAANYPKKQGTYDCLYMPRASYHSSYLALHDMGFVDDKLVAVNTLFSTLCYIDHKQSFTPFWQPPFISDLMPEDRCHLNGMAIEDDEIKYLTALGSANSYQGWRMNKMNGGILMEYPSGKIILDGLSMPHSPRIYDGKLYLLNSALGELIEVDRQNGTYKVIVDLGGFARGMDRLGDYLFIGMSKMRHVDEAFSDLSIVKTSFAGVIAVHLPTATIVGRATYLMSVDELYDVKLLPGKIRPNIVSADMEVHQQAIEFNDMSFWTVADKKMEIADAKSHPEGQIEIQVQVMKNMAADEVPKLFGNMIGKDLANAIKKGESGKSMNLIVSSHKSNPLGLVVFEAKANHTARILSVFVKPEHRRKGIAKLLLSHLQTLLQQNDIQYTEAAFSQASVDKAIVTKLFAGFEGFNLRIEE